MAPRPLELSGIAVVRDLPAEQLAAGVEKRLQQVLLDAGVARSEVQITDGVVRVRFESNDAATRHVAALLQWAQSLFPTARFSSEVSKLVL